MLLDACAIVGEAQQAIAPHSGYQSQASKDAPTLDREHQARSSSLADDWRKDGLESDRRLCGGSRDLPSAGEGVALGEGVHLRHDPRGQADDRADRLEGQGVHPEAAAKTGKAIILVQSGIHSGEIEGKDTALMLVRDMAVVKHPEEAAWLDKAIFVVIPVFNIDGHESRSPFNRAMQNGPEVTGLRNTQQGLNLNRDYVRGDTPEMRAWLKLYNAGSRTSCSTTTSPTEPTTSTT